MRFSRLNQVNKHFVTKKFENLSKYFLRLEVPLARKSRREPRKLLSKLTTEASTHEQVAKQSLKKSKNPKFLKNFLSLFHDWDFDPPVSRENLLSKLTTGGM